MSPASVNTRVFARDSRNSLHQKGKARLMVYLHARDFIIDETQGNASLPKFVQCLLDSATDMMQPSVSKPKSCNKTCGDLYIADAHTSIGFTEGELENRRQGQQGNKIGFNICS